MVENRYIEQNHVLNLLIRLYMELILNQYFPCEESKTNENDGKSSSEYLLDPSE